MHIYMPTYIPGLCRRGGSGGKGGCRPAPHTPLCVINISCVAILIYVLCVVWCLCVINMYYINHVSCVVWCVTDE